MTQITYAANSPYYTTPQTSWYINRWVYRPIPPDAGDQTMILSSNYLYRPDKLSNDLYGSPAYWWVFCIRNPFLRSDPIWNFIPGIEIIVPSANYLKQLLGG